MCFSSIRSVTHVRTKNKVFINPSEKHFYSSIGNITTDVADHCTQVYISTSNGALVVPRICENGSLSIEKDTIRIVEYLPPFIRNAIRKRLMQRNGFNITSVEKLDVKTKSVSNIIVNDDIGICVSSGKVKVRAAIEKVKDKTIYFKDGKVENDIDVIILCTGYKRSFPFLKKNDLMVEKHDKYIPLYKGIFLSKYGPYLAFTGMTSQSIPLLVTAEMQARYTAEVFKKKITLPNKQNMEKSIRLVELQMETVVGKNLKEYNYVSTLFQLHEGPIVQQVSLRKNKKLFIQDYFTKCDQIRCFLRIWSHSLKKSLMENFIFCAVY